MAAIQLYGLSNQISKTQLTIARQRDMAYISMEVRVFARYTIVMNQIYNRAHQNLFVLRDEAICFLYQNVNDTARWAANDADLRNHQIFYDMMALAL